MFNPTPPSPLAGEGQDGVCDAQQLCVVGFATQSLG